MTILTSIICKELITYHLIAENEVKIIVVKYVITTFCLRNTIHRFLE